MAVDGGHSIDAAHVHAGDRIRRLRTLAWASRSVSGSLDLDRVLGAIVEGAVAIVDSADSGLLSLRDDSSGLLVVRAAAGFTDAICNMSVLVGQGLSGDVFSTGLAVVHDAAAAAERMANLAPEQRATYREASGGLDSPKAALVVPLVVENDLIGVMAVENLRSEGTFDAFDLELTETLADQAAVALQNARLYESERRSRRMLSKSLDIHESLSNLVLRGFSVADIAAKLSELLGAPVRITDTFCNILASSYTPEEEPKLAAASLGVIGNDPLTVDSALRLLEPYGEIIAVPVVGANEPMGLVVVGPVADELDGLASAAAGHAAVAVGLSMLKEREVAEAERKLHGDLLAALIADDCVGKQHLDRRAIALGLDPSAAYGIGMLIPRQHGPARNTPERLARLRWIVETMFDGAGDGVVIEKDARLVVLKRLLAEAEAQQSADLRSWWTTLEKACAGDGDTLIVAGPLCPELGALGGALQEIDRATALLVRMNALPRLVFTESMGSYHLLLQVTDRTSLVEFADRVLVPIERYDSKNNTELVPTLRCYLAANRKLGACASELHVHPHSVRYRLDRVHEICQGDCDEADYWLCLELALRIRDLLG
ncbi:helix-turn-helix domain-containing protein [Amycolatopsis jejuensis]|uniref:helix-turn-helix domain-containing protein n=1 Tax=Amycolatopsis jejuensis TaxID=330084 RepID=UPI000525E5A2|nr:GAF domain-containing protein [Amycolatopsis jejuensis]